MTKIYKLLIIENWEKALISNTMLEPTKNTHLEDVNLDMHEFRH